MQNIGIIGCGWLGLPLAKSLLKDGFTVHGTTTSSDKIETLKNAGIKAYNISLFEDRIEGPISDFLHSLDIIVINVPPRLRGKKQESFVKKMSLLKNKIKTSLCSKIIFASSTAVYGNTTGIINEKTTVSPNTESGKQLVLSENMLLEDSSLQTTIIRFGGLIGPNRHPITILSGKTELKNGNASVNLIHLEDCISILKESITNNWSNELINAVYPSHPTKKEYYTQEAIKRGIVPPKYADSPQDDSKRVSSYFLTNVKNYHFHTSIFT
ncbi:NAD(P)-binding domain-containing protein [Maribacter sp.]|uniref:NAD(P)-binding domain-containing protein n=1 Tax=Maribacter sp. TaxID=1897614 RepID=UPI0025C2D30C|nr:NAD(P)-binding domain-containing protein [Maribacter sp.]